LRAQDWVPRLVRNRADAYKRAWNALKTHLDRDPSTRELAIHLGTTDEEVEALRRESNLTTVFTLCREDENNDDPHVLRKLDVLVDHQSEVPFDELVTRDLAASFAKVLTEAERTVVALYYHESLTMKEIGRVMRISESRVCQIHTKTLKKLKDHLDGIAEGRRPKRKPPDGGGGGAPRPS
jgi:RNA polymerase sigma factor for flagellar operon FliA